MRKPVTPPIEPNSPLVSGAAALAPHPRLTRYYRDSEASRRMRVDQMFNASAIHYDWITGVMSLGSGNWYRRDALKRHGLRPGQRVLDVGCGTGAVALAAQQLAGEDHVVALDPSPGMLGQALQSGVRRGVLGLGEVLPFPDAHFDLLTMGYALRHVEDLQLAFREYARVLKPGGTVLLLEISRPRNRLQYLWLKVYMKFVIPMLTRLFRRSADAQELMEYYWDTIDQCVPPEVILDALRASGLAEVRRKVMLGTFSEYSARRAAA